MQGFRTADLLTEAEREVFQRDDAPSAVPQGSPPPAEEKSEATLRSVSIADLKLPTERKYCYIDSVFENSDLVICRQR